MRGGASRRPSTRGKTGKKKLSFLIFRFMGSHKALGLSVVDFRRTFPPGDAHDAPIALDGPTQVMEIHKIINAIL